jgi:hypothetical protein
VYRWRKRAWKKVSVKEFSERSRCFRVEKMGKRGRKLVSLRRLCLRVSF